jgi:pimeloyl-ACP methyl ester carboxylesterase
MGTSVFKSEAAKARMADWYERFLAKINVPTESIFVQTSFGKSHVLAVGDSSKPPMVCFHSMMTSSAHLLSELQVLSRDFYLLGADIPGQSVQGIAEHLSYTDDTHSKWVGEVLDGLNLDAAHILGVSLGGFVARQFASNNPSRVKSLTLIVPGGIIQGSLIKGFSKMAWPMIKYRMRPTEKNLRPLVNNLITTWDDDWAHYIGNSFTDFNPYLKIPSLAKDYELTKLSMPVLIIGAEHDISFPGQAIIDRMKKLVPHVETELLIGAKHSPPTTPEFRKWLANRVTQFVKS